MKALGGALLVSLLCASGTQATTIAVAAGESILDDLDGSRNDIGFSGGPFAAR